MRWWTTIFLYPFTERKSYSIVTPFEPNDFSFWTLTKDHLPHWGADIERNYEQSNLEKNAYAKRQMKKKKCETILQKVEMYKEKKNVEKCKKKSSKEKIWGKIKILHMTINDPWSDHPKNTTLGLFILFLYKPEPDLHYVLWKSIWIKCKYLS